MAQPNNNRVFIVDDDALHNDMLKKFLEDKFNVQVMAFTNGDDAARNLQWQPSYVFCDYYLDKLDTGTTKGFDLLRQVRQALPDTQFIVMSTQDKMDVTVDAMKHGAFDHIVKNTTEFLRVENSMTHALRIAKLRRKVKSYQTAVIVFVTLFVAALAVAYFLYQHMNGEPVSTVP